MKKLLSLTIVSILLMSNVYAENSETTCKEEFFSGIRHCHSKYDDGTTSETTCKEEFFSGTTYCKTTFNDGTSSTATCKEEFFSGKRHCDESISKGRHPLIILDHYKNYVYLHNF